MGAHCCNGIIRVHKYLGEDEVHVDPGDDEDEWGQHPKRELVRVPAPKDKRAQDDEEEGRRGRREDGRDKPTQDDGQDTLVGREAVRVALRPLHTVGPIVHDGESHDPADYVIIISEAVESRQRS